MKLRLISIAATLAFSAAAQAADTAPAQAVPQSPEAWVNKMTDFTQNASAYKDPKTFVPWLNAVTEPSFAIAGMKGAMTPNSWLNMASSMTQPAAAGNWMWVVDPNVYMKWLQASADPAFYTSVLTTATDPNKMMRWAMMPADPKLWGLMVDGINPTTYLNWAMATLDPRVMNLMGSAINPGLYANMMGAMVNPGLNPWLNMQAPAPAATPAAAPAPAPAPAAPAPVVAAPAAAPVVVAPVVVAPVVAPVVAEAPAAAPVAAPAPAPVGKVILAGDALFKLSKSGIKDLSKDGKARLDELAKQIKAMGEVEQIRIVGHADISGKASNNLKLSESRARSVKSYLVAKGVKSSVIVTSGAGDTQPVATCDMNQPKKELIECLAPNRRVEIEIIGKAK